MRLLIVLFVLTANLDPLLGVEKVRAIWRADPATSIVIAWVGPAESGAQVYYGTEAAGGTAAAYPEHHPVDRSTDAKGMTTHFVRLEDLTPDTVYHLVIAPPTGTGPTYHFRTAPAEPRAFAFCAGGDSRNHRTARQAANRAVERLQPLFVAFAGDMTDKSRDDQWQDWFDDWELTTSSDGRLIPLVVARGNHERRNRTLVDLFDCPHPSIFYSLRFGGELLQLISLNSEISADGKQAAWLAETLQAADDCTWIIAQYHKPMRPHVEKKKEQHEQYRAWTPLFDQHQVDLVIECDSHCVKRTWPIRPSDGPGSDEGFIRDDARGTVYIGEGCWGAPLRAADDRKSWTRAADAFNQINWILVAPDGVRIATVPVDRTAEIPRIDPTATPAIPDDLPMWQPDSGAVISLAPRSR